MATVQVPLLVMNPSVKINHKTKLKFRYQLFEQLENGEFKFVEEYNNIDDVLARGNKLDKKWAVNDTLLKAWLTPPEKLSV